MSQSPIRTSCEECGADLGKRHSPTCELARCEATGLRILDCPCPPWDVDAAGEPIAVDPAEALNRMVAHGPDVWIGEWAMLRDCREARMMIVWDGGRGQFLRCRPDEVGAAPDMDRLVEQCRWWPKAGKWRRRRAAIYTRGRIDGPAQGNELKQLEDLRWFAEQEGYDVMREYADDEGRIGYGLKNALVDIGEGRIEALLVKNQKVLGSSNATRRNQMAKIREAGGGVRSMDLWDGGQPSTTAERDRISAKVEHEPWMHGE